METILGTHIVASGKVLQIEGVDIDFGNGKTATFEMASFKPKDDEPSWGVIICGYDTYTTEIILIQQFQVALGQPTYLLPRWGLLAWKSKQESAAQEFLEETGYEAEQWIEMPMIYTSPWYFNQQTTIFFAYDITLSENNVDGDEFEDTLVHRISLANAIDMIMQGSIVDARTIATILMMRQYLETNSL